MDATGCRGWYDLIPSEDPAYVPQTPPPTAPMGPFVPPRWPANTPLSADGSTACSGVEALELLGWSTTAWRYVVLASVWG